MHRVATKWTTKQELARRHNKEGGDQLELEINRQRTMEGTDGGLQPAVEPRRSVTGEKEIKK